MYIYIYLYLYIKRIAKLYSVGYSMSASTSQEKEHSLAYVQKCENKDVCVECGVGLTAVPNQVALPSWVLPPASSWLRRWSKKPGDSHLYHPGTSPLRGDDVSLWKMPNQTSYCPCKGKVLKPPAPLTRSDVHPAPSRPSRLWLTSVCVCFLFSFQHQVCSSWLSEVLVTVVRH